MILGRITAKAQTTVPRAVRLALGVAPGDDLVWEIDGDRVLVSRARVDEDDGPFSDFSTFTEWADELDSVYDDL